MAKYKEKPVFQWVYTGISIGIVLFFLLLLGSSFFLAQNFLKKSKEKISFAVEFKENTPQSDTEHLQMFLEEQDFYLVGTFEFNSKDSIENLFSPQLEDSLSGYLDLPFRDVVFFNVKENYVNPTDLVLIKSKLLRQKGVDKVYYEQINVAQLNRSIKKALVILLAVGAVLLVLTFLFLYNTLRMGLNYRSDVIYNQLLLGASPFFIARPMILRVLITSLLAIVFAVGTFLLIARFLIDTVAGLRQLWSENIVIYLALLTALIILTIVVFSIFILRKNLRLMRWEN
ncbi:MAG TPA: hypothetical protein VJ917_04735 [Saprospiraceae bacterium]|nr:hypothetical protein [Saprospiraceae bacterium]